MKLSIVATLYQSATYINEFYERATAAAKQLVGDDYEIVLVNDGSPDSSLVLAIKLTEQDHHVVVVDLSRNFGHHKAMMTGLAHATGEQVFLIDSDLEEEPEWLLSFASQMESEECDVVYGVQEQRKGGRFEQWSGRCFYLLFNWLTKLNLQANIVTARLMSRCYVDALLLHREREVMIAGLWHITGFIQNIQIVRKKSTSETTYTFHQKISILIDAITSFSNSPLIGIFYFGIFVSVMAVIYVTYLVINKLFFAASLSGWTSVMASVWLLGGTIISFIGIIGIYLAKVFSEAKQRPYTIVKRVYEKNYN